jgi:hypothetical protein
MKKAKSLTEHSRNTGEPNLPDSGRITGNPEVEREGRVTSESGSYHVAARIEMPNATTSMVASYGHLALN